MQLRLVKDRLLSEQETVDKQSQIRFSVISTYKIILENFYKNNNDFIIKIHNAECGLSSSCTVTIIERVPRRN